MLECDDAADRVVLLERECSSDPELRRRVEALLSAHDQADRLPDRPVAGTLDRSVAPVARREITGPSHTEAESPLGGPEVPGTTIGPEADSRHALDDRLAMTLRVAPVVSGYEILEELGRGGMGVVYKARQIQLDRPCALKMILGGAHARPDAAARFLAEARAIAHLQHPYIVQIHHIGEADGLPFFELEYVDGGSLDKVLDGTLVARPAGGRVR